MKITILADRLVLGGLETHIITFANELLRRNHRILLCTEYASPDIISAIQPSGQAFHHVNGFTGWTQAVRSFDPDIIHAHPFAAIKRGINLARNLRKPLFVSMHGFYDAGLRQHINGARGTDKISRIIAVDNGVAAFIKDDIPDFDRISVIYNGISLAKFNPLARNIQNHLDMGLLPQYLTIVTVSRLDDDKSPPVFQLIRCAAELALRLNGINLVVVGDGNMTAALRAEAESAMSLNNSVKIVFTGPQLDVARYLTTADLVVACDRAAMEAMACGRPVLAGNGMGFAGLIDHTNYRDILCYRRGYLPLTDAELTSRLTQVLQSPAILQQAAEWGPVIARENFDILKKVDELEELYNQFLKSAANETTDSFDARIPQVTIKVNPIKVLAHGKNPR